MVLLLTLLLTALPGEPTAAAPADVPRTVSAPRGPAPADLLSGRARRIRAGNRRLAGLMMEGVRRSPTFAGLVSKVHATNVIIYLESYAGLPLDVTGRIGLQTVAGGQRYLRVQVRPDLDGDQTIAVIGHELQHALEVAADPAVVDEAGVAALYRRIGHRSGAADGYDTDAARATGRLVRGELSG